LKGGIGQEEKKSQWEEIIRVCAKNLGKKEMLSSPCQISSANIPSLPSAETGVLLFLISFSVSSLSFVEVDPEDMMAIYACVLMFSSAHFSSFSCSFSFSLFHVCAFALPKNAPQLS
jgi:hypothetical protein